MVARALTAALLASVSLSLPACGSASDGAALLRGSLFHGQPPWETSLDRTATAVVHGSLPFRVVLALPGPEQATGREGKRAGLTLQIRNLQMPPSGEALAVGAAGGEGPQATVEWIPEAGPSPDSEALGGGDVRYSDGGFSLRATSGRLKVDFTGREPGDGVTGELELVFGTAGVVRGSFAAALAD
ncbi:MAG: hypothetical protein HY901_38210 [Deltaproteobacteria bacterium]|nr:hypothetical protein [Deltaproteobacteria bacterium]